MEDRPARPGGQRGHDRLDHLAQVTGVAGAVGEQVRLGPQLRQAERRHRLRPVPEVGDRHAQRTVGGLVERAGGAAQRAAVLPARLLPGGVDAGDPPWVHAECHRLQFGDVDPLRAPRRRAARRRTMKRGRGGQEAGRAGQVPGLVAGHPQRGFAADPVDRAPSGQGGGGQLVARLARPGRGRAVGGDRQQHPGPRGRGDVALGDDDVRPGADRGGFGRVVDHDRPLVPVDVGVDGGVVRAGDAVEERRFVPQRVTPGRLGQDHVGPEVAEQPGREGAGKPARGIDDPQAVERTGRHRHAHARIVPTPASRV